MLALHRTIREIDAKEWDRVTGENAFATHRWLLTVETYCRVPLQPLYFTLRTDRALAAAAVCYVMSPTAEMESLDDLLLGRLRKPAGWMGIRFLPALVCGPLLGYGWHIGVSPDLSVNDAHDARSHVLEAMEAEACAMDLQLAFVHILDSESDLKNLLHDRRYLRCRNAPLAILEVKWASFDEYLAGLTRKRRGEFRRQISRHHEEGNSVVLAHSCGAEEDRLLGLINQTARKHNAYPFAFGHGFFEELQHDAGARVWLLSNKRENQITGVCAAIVHNEAVFPFAIGVSEDQAGNDYTYFQLGYYSMIARATDSGMRRIYYGRGMYKIKLRRGCRLTDTWIYSQQSGARRLLSAPWFLFASLWNLHKLPAVAKRSLREARN